MKSPAFSFYVRDWLCSKTVSKLHSKPCSKGVSAYLYLLCSAWLEDPPATLPNDDVELAGYARLSLEEWQALKPDLMCQFTLNSQGRLINERLMAEWLKQQQRKQAGSKGGSKKLANRVAKGIAAHEDENEDENGILKLGGVGGIKPEDIYQEYPRKVGKPDAIRAITRAMERAKPEFLLERTRAYAATRKGDLTYMPNPSTWFNQERYNDDPSTWVRSEPNSQASKPNPRNVGQATDIAAKDRAIVEHLKRQEEQRKAANAAR